MDHSSDPHFWVDMQELFKECFVYTNKTHFVVEI